MRQAGPVQSVQTDSSTAAGRYFEAVSEAFHRASQSTGGGAGYGFRVGGHSVGLRFAGQALVPGITRALAHLEAEPDGPPDFTIRLWDTASTGVGLPEPPWDVKELMSRKEMWAVRGQRYSAFSDPMFLRKFILLDRESDSAFYWTPDAAALPFAERAAPLRDLLHWWLRDHGYQLMHAGAVGTPEGGVLLGGDSGAGKSTAALSCLHSSLRYASDDYVLLNASGPPFVHTIYSTGKLQIDHMRRRLPDLVAALSNPHELPAEKALLYLHEHFSQALIEQFPLKAIVIPRLSHESAPRILDISPVAALQVIAASTHLQLRWLRREDLRHIIQAFRKVPAYILELGANPGAVPGAILELLAKH